MVSGDTYRIKIMTTELYRLSWEIWDEGGFIMDGFGMESLHHALDAIDKSISDN